MKKALLFVWAVMIGIGNAQAQNSSGTTYTDESASVIWPFDDSSNYTECTATPDGAFSVTSVDIGDATITGTGTGQATDDDGNSVTFIKIQPATASTDVVEWYVKPAAGLTFTPTKVSAYIQRFGTDVSSGVTVSAQLTDGTSVTLGTFTAPRNNKTQDEDKYGTNEDYTNKFEIELTDEQQSTLSSTDGFSLVCTIGVGTSKQGGFSDVHIEGLLNGTIEEVNKYTVTIAASPEDGGEVSIYPEADEYEEGTEVEITAEKNFGYSFINWTDGDGNVVSEEASFTYTVNADVTLTANFEAVTTHSLTYSVEGGANLYMVQPSPEPTEVDGTNMYEEGTVVTLTASSNEILTFTNWSDGQTSAEITLTMDEDKTITASYSAIDFIVGWDFYTEGSDGRLADFAAADNDAVALVLRDSTGNTSSWLDKSEESAGGYEGRDAAVNWRTTGLGEYYWQTMVNASAFTDIKVISAMLYNYNAYTTYNVQYSLDGETWTTIGQHVMEGSKNWNDGEFEVPEDANNQEKLYIRWIADKTSEIDGTESDNDGIAISGIYIIGTEAIVDDGTAPVLTSTVPEEGSSTASANGKVVLTFDEKVQVADDAEATLGSLTLTPEVSGKSVIFEYKGLDYSTDYTFTLPGNSVSDLTDNYYTDDIVINFTTMTRAEVTKSLYDFIVPDDGTFKEAIAAADDRDDTNTRYRIFVKKGDYTLPYDENTLITNNGVSLPSPITYLNTPNVSIIGEDMEETVITNDMKDKTESGTSYPIEGLHNVTTLYLQSAATNTYIQDLTLKNGLNDNTGRGEALEDNSNKTICKDVTLWGYQDTYCSNNSSGRFYFEGGLLRGRTDFLCGKGDVYYNEVELQMCTSGGYIAVPSTPKEYGYIFRDCTITGGEDGVTGNYTLGRPWGDGTPIALYINTVMEVIPSDVGWSEMSDGWPARFAEYNSMTSSGTVIDLSNRKTIFADTHENNPELTEEEADALTISTVMGSDDDWDPTSDTEQASAPTNVVISGSTLTWDDNSYVLCWAICKDGDVIDFTIEPTYEVDDTTSTYSVRAANEMGGLGDATEAVEASATAITSVNASGSNADVISVKYYNLQGMRVNDSSAEGVIIKVETTSDGRQTATKLVNK